MKMYKVAEAAAMLGISKQTLLRYEKKGVFPPSRRNRINSWRQYSSDDLIKMKERLGRGFTLMETVMVMVVMGVIAALIIPRVYVVYAIRLSSASQKILSDARYVQQVAMSRHTNTSLTFDPALNRYAAFEESPPGSGSWQNLADPFSREWLTVDFGTDAQYRGIDIESVSFVSGSLIYDRNGRVSAGGDVAFSLAGETKTLHVEQETGYAKIQ